MVLFDIYGPFKIPCYRGRAGRAIDRNQLPQFWARHKAIAGCQGCYVFAIQAGKGYTPIYVGKATRSFERECFTYHKLDRYHRCLVDYVRGTPIMFFLVLPKTRGKVNVRLIGELESYLITLGETANPRLSNVRGRSREGWGIRGVVRGGHGKPGPAARKFRRLMEL